MSFLEQALRDIEAAGLLRTPVTVEGEQSPVIRVGPRTHVNLCSNNYLGLADHPQLKAEAARAALQYGVGAGASRLVSGTMSLHLELEEALARFKGTQAALLFNSGYQCNTGVIPALAGSGDLIFSDELNHASLIDGCRLARAPTKIYWHNDIGHLEDLLKRYRKEAIGEAFIVTEGLFSMEGDIAPVPELVSLADRYRAHLIIDEAHANGTLGRTGRGVLEHFGIDPARLTAGERVILIGTLGKAFGAFGAFVAGSRVLYDFLVNRCRTFIFTTALPPPVVAAALEAVRILQDDPTSVRRLYHRVNFLADDLTATAGARAHPTPIFSLVVGDPRRAVRLSAELAQAGFFVQAIRPPTVPEGTSRLRITVTSEHTEEQLGQFCEALRSCGVALRYSDYRGLRRPLHGQSPMEPPPQRRFAAVK